MSFVNDINAKLTELSEKFNKFTSKYDKVYSEVKQCKTLNSHLLTSIIHLEHNAVINASRVEGRKLNLTLHLLKYLCKALSLTWVNVDPKYLHACHRIYRSDRVITTFKCRKQKQPVTYKRKHLSIKSQELLKFSGTFFVSESMFHENQQLTYKCRQLKRARKTCSTLSFSNVVNVKLVKLGRIHKIFHVADIENLLETEILEEYINCRFSYARTWELVNIIVGTKTSSSPINKCTK